MDDVLRTLAARYQLLEVIGRGGMGTVYRATDLLLGRSVAVKVLPGLLADQDPTSVARFEREARAAAALSHPAIVAVYDTGVDETARFIVMELLAGRSLEAILRADGPLPPDRAARIAGRIADALAAAHGAGIVHRDIKPANVMIAADGSVKVLDFGIARAIDSTTITQNAMVLGTAAYMAPEQALGSSADERSDVYSLGCVLYALLAGGPPFTGDNAAAILNQHTNVAPPPLDTRNRQIPPALAVLVRQMLAKSPEDRAQTAVEVRKRLAPLSSVSATPASGTAVTARHVPTLLGPPQNPKRPLRRLIALGAAVAAAALVVALVVLASGGGPPRAKRHRHSDRGTSKATATTPRARSTPTTTPTAPTAPTTSTAATAATAATATTTSSHTTLTVPQAAGALTALTAQEVQSAGIDQPAAQQLSNSLSDILNAYEMGHTMDVQHKLGDLANHVAMLEQHGDITSAAAPAINRAVANLSTAMTSATPPTPQSPGGKPAKPPGHGGGPPGKAQQGGD